MADLQRQISVRTSVRPDQRRIGARKGTRPLEFGSRCNFSTEILFLGRMYPYVILMDANIQD